jgi:hypothetical protein
MIPKLLVGVAAVAISLSVSSGATAAASADPNPFSHLSCACRDSDPPGSPTLTDKINQGIRQGLAAPPAVQ